MIMARDERGNTVLVSPLFAIKALTARLWRRNGAVVQLSYLESLCDVMQAWAALPPYVCSQ